MFIFFIKDAISNICLQGEIPVFQEDFSLKKGENIVVVEAVALARRVEVV
jgi:hypothetical protein